MICEVNDFILYIILYKGCKVYFKRMLVKLCINEGMLGVVVVEIWSRMIFGKWRGYYFIFENYGRF